jgi:hypothetical protein
MVDFYDLRRYYFKKFSIIFQDIKGRRSDVKQYNADSLRKYFEVYILYLIDIEIGI